MSRDYLQTCSPLAGSPSFPPSTLHGSATLLLPSLGRGRVADSCNVLGRKEGELASGLQVCAPPITGSLSLAVGYRDEKNIFFSLVPKKTLIFAKSAREGSLPTHCPSASHGTILPQFSEPQTSLFVHPCTHQNGSAVKWFTLSMARISSRFHCTAGLQNFLSVVSARICH